MVVIGFSRAERGRQQAQRGSHRPELHTELGAGDFES